MFTCSVDIDNNRFSNVLDLIAVWETAGTSPEDLNGDEIVNVHDLLILIGAWGPCYGC